MCHGLGCGSDAWQNMASSRVLDQQGVPFQNEMQKNQSSGKMRKSGLIESRRLPEFPQIVFKFVREWKVGNPFPDLLSETRNQKWSTFWKQLSLYKRMAKYEASSIDGSSFLLIFERFCSAFGLCGAVSHLQRNSSSPTGVETYPSVVRYGETKLIIWWWLTRSWPDLIYR